MCTRLKYDLLKEMHAFTAFRDLALSPANLRDSLTIFAENSMSTSRNAWNCISCSRVHLGFQERLTDFLQIQGLVYSSARLGTSSTIPIVLSLLPVKTGCEEPARFEVWGSLEQCQACTSAWTRIFFMSEPVPIWPASHRMMERKKGWEQINCHLTEIPSSIVAAFPISKECAPVQTLQTVQAVQGTVQTMEINGDPWWLSSVCPWSIDPDPDSSAAIKL